VINGFRLRHLDRFVDVFVQVLRLCGWAGSRRKVVAEPVFGQAEEARRFRSAALSSPSRRSSCRSGRLATLRSNTPAEEASAVRTP